MSNISPLSGKDAWVKYFQSRGLTQEQAQNAVDTVDLSDGLNQEEAATLGLEAEATIDRFIRQGWQADGEGGVETEEQGVNVVEADELERAYAAIGRYADAHNISYEQAQRIYFQAEISFTRQSLSEVKTQREATRDSLVAEYSAQSLTFTDWAKERFGITNANDPVLANLTAYITAHADASPEQLVDYLLLNGFAARLTADIQTDPTEGDNPGLGLSQAITGRTAPTDYQVATLEPFYRSAPTAATVAETPATEAPAETAPPPPADPETSPVETAAAEPTETIDDSGVSEETVEDGPEVMNFYESSTGSAEDTQFASAVVRVPGDLSGDFRLTQDGRSQTADQLVLIYDTSIELDETEQESLERLSTTFGIYDWKAVYDGVVLTGWLPASSEGMQILTDGLIAEVPAPYVAVDQERLIDYENGNDIDFAVLDRQAQNEEIPVVAVEPQAPAALVEPPVVAEVIPHDVIENRQEPSPVVSAPSIEVAAPEPDIAPIPTIEPTPTVVAEAPAPPPATPRQTAGESLADLIETNDYNLGSLATLLPGQENFSLRGVLNAANNQIRGLGQGNPLKDQLKAEYVRLLTGLSAVLQTADIADDQPAIDALNGLNNLYYSFESAEMAATRGDYGGAIETYEGIENPPAFMIARLAELRGIRDTAAAEQTALADLRAKAREEYQKILDYVSENNLTDQDLSNNLAWAATQIELLDSMQDPRDIQKFIDALPGIRTMGDQVVARREVGELAEANAGVGTESAPPAARGNLGQIPTTQLISANPQVPADRVEIVLQDKWQGIADKFNGIARSIAQRNAYQYVAISGYLEFNPSTGRIRWAEIGFSSDSGTVSDFATLGRDANGDGTLEEVGINEALVELENGLRFTPDSEFTADSHYQDVGGGWYRYNRRMRATASAN